MAALAVNAEFPEPFQPLFSPARYKVYYGGRGGGKSWAFARALLLIGLQRPIRVLCAREFQNSMKDSVHKLLSDQVDALGLHGHYEVLQAVIRGANGTEFAFEGIKHNTGKIKSYEGIDICWVEEAVNVSKDSWETLIPTIRKAGSEIWLSFNPELETDETYKRFVKRPPLDCVSVKVTWRDNPWFESVLRAEMQDLKDRDYDAYLHVWEGHCKQVLDGAVYAEELRTAIKLERIMRVPYDHTKPVSTFWDLGFSDMTSIWFAQVVGFEYHIIDYYQNRLHGIDHYLKELQDRNYVYDTDWLPHDAKAKQLSAAGRSIEEQMRAKGRRVRIVPRHRISDGIAAARTIFPNCYFDAERCEDGVQSLRHYRFELNEDRQTFSREPLHDWASHGADAFRMLAMSLKEPKKRRDFGLPTEEPEARTLGSLFRRSRGESGSSNSWMEG